MSILEKYTDPSNPGAFSALSGFKKNNKFKDYSALKNNNAFVLHKQAIRKFNRRSTIANEKDHFWQIDLIDMKRISTSNKSVTFLLCCIDVLSKFSWVVGLKNKNAETCASALQSIFKTGRVPQFIYADKGKKKPSFLYKFFEIYILFWSFVFLGNEFKGAVKKLCNEYGVTQLDTRSIHKASIVERFNRTLLSKISRYLTYNKTKTYINVLDKLVYSYNHSFHSAIQCAPYEVNKSNIEKIKKRLYGDENKNELVEFAFKIGEYVRCIEDKSVFSKGYSQNWSDQVFVIEMLNPSKPPTYKIKSLNGETFDWLYYKEELQSVPNSEFPYDSFEVLDKKNKFLLIKQLNSTDQKKEWVQRVQPKRKTKL
jgi:hypothetical protein